MRADGPFSSAESVARDFLILAVVAFACSSLIGFAAALKTALPETFLAWVQFPVVRTLHVFFAVAAVLAGAQALILSILGPQKRRWAARLQLAAMAGFIFIGAAAQALKFGTGREYFSWPAPLTVLLLLALSLMLWRLFSAAAAMERRSPEGFWLVGLGLVLIVASLVESELWRLDAVASAYVRNLTLQWHAIDTFFAGVNVALYGCAVYLMSDKPKPLRRPTLFFVAGFGLLFTFGHHHYVSPQPDFLKSLAFVASMIAILSFWRHVAAYRKMPGADFGGPLPSALWRSVELWTLVSIASGVLFAIPQFNLIVHGTYFIVAHAMGSMIGVNFMIVAAGGFATGRRPDAAGAARALAGVRLVNLALVLIWVVLGAAGLAKGIMRVSGGYHDYEPVIERLIYGFPAAGAVLLGGIGLLCVELVRANGTAPIVRRAAEGAAKPIQIKDAGSGAA